MTLFQQLTPEAEELIRENIELVNANIEAWIMAEKKIQLGKPYIEQILKALYVEKLKYNPNAKPLEASHKRINNIQRLIRQGYGIKQFCGVIMYKVRQAYTSDEFRPNWLTPETLFGQDNFVKYLEEARENFKVNKRQGDEYH